MQNHAIGVGWAVGCAVMLAGMAGARGQAVPPFFGGGVAAFEPEIRVINSGVILDAQAVVSQDRKYVTINAQPTNTQLLALRAYSLQTGTTHLGFVGGVELAVSDDPPSPRRGGPADLAPHPIGSSVLMSAGMFYLGK